MRKTRVSSLGQEDPLEKEMATHSSILAGKSHGRRSVVGYSPWGHKESDTIERFHFYFHYQILKSKLHLKFSSFWHFKMSEMSFSLPSENLSTWVWIPDTLRTLLMLTLYLSSSVLSFWLTFQFPSHHFFSFYIE